MRNTKKRTDLSHCALNRILALFPYVPQVAWVVLYLPLQSLLHMLFTRALLPPLHSELRPNPPTPPVQASATQQLALPPPQRQPQQAPQVIQIHTTPSEVIVHPLSPMANTRRQQEEADMDVGGESMRATASRRGRVNRLRTVGEVVGEVMVASRSPSGMPQSDASGVNLSESMRLGPSSPRSPRQRRRQVVHTQSMPSKKT